jgi:hypothetical protein
MGGGSDGSKGGGSVRVLPPGTSLGGRGGELPKIEPNCAAAGDPASRAVRAMMDGNARRNTQCPGLPLVPPDLGMGRAMMPSG